MGATRASAFGLARNERSGVSRPAREPLDVHDEPMCWLKRFWHRGHTLSHRNRAAYAAPLVSRQAVSAGSCGARNRHRVAERVGGQSVAYGSAVNECGGMPALVCRHIAYRPIPPGGANLANWLYPIKQRGYATGSSIPSL